MESATASSNDVIASTVEFEPPVSEDPDPVCIACLGVLQSEFSTGEFIESIHSAITGLKFEFTTFLCSISMPVSMLVRDHSIYLMIKELNPGIYAVCAPNGGDQMKYLTVAAVKDVWKWINGPALAAKLKVNFDQNSLFEVAL